MFRRSHTASRPEASTPGLRRRKPSLIARWGDRCTTSAGELRRAQAERCEGVHLLDATVQASILDGVGRMLRALDRPGRFGGS